MECGECNNQEIQFGFTAAPRSSPTLCRRWEQAFGQMGLVGLMGCRREREKEKPAPAFPEPLKKEEENSQRCLGTVGAALVEAQGVRGRENSSKTLK